MVNYFYFKIFLFCSSVPIFLVGHCTTKFIKLNATLDSGRWAKPRCPMASRISFDFLWRTSANGCFEMPRFPDTTRYFSRRFGKR